MSELHDRLKAALSARYELEHELGRGGMAVVYLARDTKQGRQVALKVFQPDIAAAMGPARFKREVEIATRLEHLHILSLYDSGEADGLLYYVMPYVEEESLRQRLDREGQLPIEDALRIAREMAEALDYAHEQGVVHRDVKPGNVLLQRRHALLADFGVARALEASGAEKLTGTGVSVGTPQYMAPEQVTGADAVDGRADVYAVGAVLYEMLTGEAPYTGSTPQAVLAKRMAGPPTPIPVLRETVSPDLDAIVQQAMARSAADRWQSAGDLAKALAAAERGGGTPIPGLSTRPGVTKEVTAEGAKVGRSRRWAGVAVAVVAVAASVVFGPMLLESLRRVETDPYRIAVVPARPDVGTDQLAAIVLGDALDGWADLRQVERSRLDARLDREELVTLGPEEAATIAEDLGAGRFVLVRSDEAAGDLSVRAELYSVGDSAARLTEVDTTASQADFADNWNVDVLLRLFRDQNLGVVLELRRAEWIAEPRAMYPYFTALALFDAGQVDSSVAYLRAAVAIDSTFGEAWNRLAYAAFIARLNAGAAGDGEAFEHYVSIEDTASSFAKRFYEPKGTALGLGQARQYAEVLHDDAATQIEVGQLYLRESLHRGFDSDSSRPFLERALELDPAGPASDLFLLHLRHNRLGEAHRVAENHVLEEAFLPWLVRFAEILRAPDLGARDSLLVVTRQEGGDLGRFAVWRSLHWQDSISIARYIADFWESTTPGTRSWIELAAGRPSALGALMSGEDSLTATDHQILHYRASVNMPGGVGESSEIVRMLREHMGAHASARWTWQMLRLWYLGMMSVRLGELEQAGAYADSMVQLATDSIAPEADSVYVQFGVDLPAEVRAAIALEMGDSDQALALLEDVTTTNDAPGDLAWIITRRRPFTRLQRGSILLDKGRFVEADGWFATFPDHEPPNEEFAFLSQALRGRAMAHDSLGRYDEALHYYRRFVTRWQDADPHLQPQVEEARQRIRELEAELS